MIKYIIKIGTILTLLCTSVSAFADTDKHNEDKNMVINVAERFHGALHSGDVNIVKKTLHKDVLVLESGHAQKSRDEYMSGHMLSDMKFVPNTKTEVKNRDVNISGDLAWMISHSHMTGEYNGKPIDQVAREMLMFKKEGDQWEITLIHWANK